MKWAMAGTWGFSMPGLRAAIPLLESGAHRLDALETAIRVVEDDPSVTSVGCYSLPNADGVLECDAAIMDGLDLSMGCVAGLSGIQHSISVARAVMTQSKHTMMVGQGAYQFARRLGFAPANKLDDAARLIWETEYEKRKSGGTLGYDTHDTVGYIVIDQSGSMAVGTSTSGLFFKLPGRVGDSPLPGCGFYVDNDKGGAVATGVGEDLMRGVVCERVVNLLAQGVDPLEAAEQVIADLHKRRTGSGHIVGYMSLLCMSTDGRVGGATNRDQTFPYSYAIDGEIKEVVCQALPGLGETAVPYAKIGV